MSVHKNGSNKKSNKHEGDAGRGDDNYTMAGTEQVDIGSVDDGEMYVIKTMHTSSNRTQVKGIEKVKLIDDSLGIDMTEANLTDASGDGKVEA